MESRIVNIAVCNYALELTLFINKDIIDIMLKNKCILHLAVFTAVFLCWIPSGSYSQTSGSSSNLSEWGEVESSTTQNQPAANSPLSLGESTDYVIQKGDCLWNLAFQFLGNPFQWPQIWQANPYIKNADLIYPGDLLKIPGRNSGASAAENQTANAFPNSAATSDDFRSKTSELLNNAKIQKDRLDVVTGNSADSMILMIIRSKDQLGGNFFTAVPFLWFERNSSGVLLPGESVVEKPGDRAMYQLFDKVLITLKKEDGFKVGDSIDLYNYFRVIEHNKARAAILKCVGSAHITEIRSNKALASLYKVFDKVVGGEHLMKASKLSSLEIDTLVSPDVTIQGSLIARAEETESPAIFQTLILEKGSQDGVKLGDVFAVYHTKNNELTSEVALVGYTANVQKNSSSMVIIKMSDNKVGRGDRAVLIRRTEFKSGGEN